MCVFSTQKTFCFNPLQDVSASGIARKLKLAEDFLDSGKSGIFSRKCSYHQPSNLKKNSRSSAAAVFFYDFVRIFPFPFPDS